MLTRHMQCIRITSARQKINDYHNKPRVNNRNPISLTDNGLVTASYNVNSNTNTFSHDFKSKSINVIMCSHRRQTTD